MSSPARDIRLPDPAEAGQRVYGDKRPRTRVPYRVRVVARRTAANEHGTPVTWEVVTNRTTTRWWITATVGSGGRVSLLDYATTTSRTKAHGWIAAVEAMVDWPG